MCIVVFVASDKVVLTRLRQSLFGLLDLDGEIVNYFTRGTRGTPRARV